MRERTNLSTLDEADSKSVARAREVLLQVKKKYKRKKLVEIHLHDINNTVIIVTRRKFNLRGKEFYVRKYAKVLSIKNRTNEIINRNIVRFIS